MPVDLSFVGGDAHRRALKEQLEPLLRAESVAAVLLTGSLARGDALPGSDIDLHIIRADGFLGSFTTETRTRIVMERKAASYEDALDQLSRHPMELYPYLDGRILHDPEGKLALLQGTARDLFDNYRTPEDDRWAIACWLKSALLKLENARRAGDRLRGAYVAATTSWPILEGLWAANSKPLPRTVPSGHTSRT